MESKVYGPCNNHGSNYGTCYYKSTSVPRSCDCPPILTFQPPNYGHNDKLMWEVRGDPAWGFWEGLWASPGEPYSAAICWTPGRTLMWLGSGFSGFTLFGLFKNKLLLERDCENCSVFCRIISKKQSFSVSFYEKVFFSFFFFGIVVYEVRERESIKERRHWKQDFLKRPSQCRPCAVIWSVLTELSRGMEKIIRRNVWGALKRSGPRDWPIGARPAERRANFFLMNSTACSTMQSDCQGWTHIWSVFGGSKWQDQFCLQRKGGLGVGRRWLLLAPPLFLFH